MQLLILTTKLHINEKNIIWIRKGKAYEKENKKETLKL